MRRAGTIIAGGMIGGLALAGWGVLACARRDCDLIVGDVPRLPEGLAALPLLNSRAGSGHERRSAAEEHEIAPHEKGL